MILVAAVLALVAAVVAASAASGRTRPAWRWYSQPETCPSTSTDDLRKWTDPIGFVFYGEHAEAWSAKHEMVQRLNETYAPTWDGGDIGSQWLYWSNNPGPGACRQMDQTLANGDAALPANRWHMRIGDVAWEHVGNRFYYYSLGTPHYDDGGGHPHCNPSNKTSLTGPNGVSYPGGSFNAARRVFKQGLRSTGSPHLEHQTSPTGWTKVRHDACGSDPPDHVKNVSSNGYVVWVRIGKYE